MAFRQRHLSLCIFVYSGVIRHFGDRIPKNHSFALIYIIKVGGVWVGLGPEGVLWLMACLVGTVQKLGSGRLLMVLKIHMTRPNFSTTTITILLIFRGIDCLFQHQMNRFRAFFYL